MTDKMIIDNWVDNTPPTEEDVYARLYFGSPATLKLTVTDVERIKNTNSWMVKFNWNWK